MQKKNLRVWEDFFIAGNKQLAMGIFDIPCKRKKLIKWKETEWMKENLDAYS